MPRFAPLAAATLSVIGLVIHAAPAHADSAAGAVAPSCYVTLGNEGGSGAISLPSNAPALPLIGASDSASATVTAELVSPTERLAFAAPTSDTHGLRILTLPSNAPGSYSVAFTTSCANGASAQEREVALTLTAAVAFPTSVGTLVHVPKNPPTGLDTIELEPTPSLRAFLPATHFRMSMDNEKASTMYGTASDSRISLSANTGAACIENGALHREKRTVRLSLAAVIAGVAEAPEPATLDVVVDCGAIKWTSANDIPGELTPAGPTTTTTNGGSSSSASGCSAAPGARFSGAAAPTLAAFALASLVALRRRRRA